jgi:hypothetical protein
MHLHHCHASAFAPLAAASLRCDGTFQWQSGIWKGSMTGLYPSSSAGAYVMFQMSDENNWYSIF